MPNEVYSWESQSCLSALPKRWFRSQLWGCVANAIFMIVASIKWYWTIPTVPPTGPANSHFITDIGLAYLCCGIILCYGVVYPSGRWMALVAGAMWLTAHGLFHVFEFVSGKTTASRFLQDAPGVLGLPLLVIAALAVLLATQRIVPACSAAHRTDARS